MVLNEYARDAIAGGGDDEAVIEADLQWTRLDRAVPVDVSGAQPEVPFSNACRRIACTAENARNGHRAGIDNQCRVSGKDAGPALAPGILPCQQRIAAGGAGRGGRVGIGEAKPLPGQMIDVRRLHLGRAVAADISITQIIGDDDNDIRRRFVRLPARLRHQPRAAQGECQKTGNSESLHRWMNDIERIENQRRRGAKLHAIARVSVCGTTATRARLGLRRQEYVCVQAKERFMLTDADLELIDAYLDDTLTTDQVEEVDIRLSGEAELVAALNDLRSQRAARAVVWRAWEPSEASSTRFAASVLSPLGRFRPARLAAPSLRSDLHLSESEIG